MSIFKYENLWQWERFSEMGKGISRLGGTTRDDSLLRATLAELPEHLADEAGIFLLDIAISRLSKSLLAFVAERGVLERPSVKNSLDVAVRIRDRMFITKSSGDLADSPYFEILKETAHVYGEAFAIDSMEAVYNDAFATKRSGAGFFADGQQKLETYSANLKLFMRFTPPKYLADPVLGNIGIKHVGAQISNIGNRNPLLEEHLELLSQLSFDDLWSITSVLGDDKIGRSAFMTRQIDAAVCKEMPDMKLAFVNALGCALETRPMNTLATLLTMKDSALSRFISSGGMEKYLTSKWIHAGNAHIMADQNFLDLHDLFNQRLLTNPFFDSVFKRAEWLYKPNSVSVTMAFLSQEIMDRQLPVEMVKTPGGSKSVASGVLKIFSESLGLIAQHANEPEVVQAGCELIGSQLRINLENLYETMSRDDVMGKKMKNSDTVDSDYQLRFAAVRLCAELHIPKPDTNRGLEKLKPIQHQLGVLDARLEHKEALLMLVSTYDEATILDALKDYKPGIRPMIELGLLSQKHISLLPAKDRGEMLETAMGL